MLTLFCIFNKRYVVWLFFLPAGFTSTGLSLGLTTSVCSVTLGGLGVGAGGTLASFGSPSLCLYQ